MFAMWRRRIAAVVLLLINLSAVYVAILFISKPVYAVEIVGAVIADHAWTLADQDATKLYTFFIRVLGASIISLVMSSVALLQVCSVGAAFFPISFMSTMYFGLHVFAAVHFDRRSHMSGMFNSLVVACTCISFMYFGRLVDPSGMGPRETGVDSPQFAIRREIPPEFRRPASAASSKIVKKE